MPSLDETDLRDLIARLATIDRPSASAGERAAAELVAAAFRDAGADRVALEEEDAHGTYWWPVGLMTALATAAGLLGRPRGLAGRVARAAAAGFAAAVVADDISGGTQWFRRRLRPRRRTTNVLAELGPADAGRTIVFVAHHDAAHSGLVFHPDLARAFGRRFPDRYERIHTTPPTMWGAFGGPALIAAGLLLGLRTLRRAGIALSAGYTAAMIDIGLRPVVPGANDNASGVATLVSVAHGLRDRPLPAHVRVLLLSTGSEEAFMEGMQAFARRHFPRLPAERTHVVCVDTVGSPHLLLLEGEGMLWMNEYPKDFLDLIRECARREEVPIWEGLRFRNATDGLIALRAGYPSAMIGSVDDLKIPSDYHWPTDTADRVDTASVAGAARLCLAVARRLADGPAPGR